MNNYPETPASTETQAHQPGDQTKMDPTPEVIKENYKGSDKLKGKVALITGGDSGIRSLCISIVCPRRCRYCHLLSG